MIREDKKGILDLSCVSPKYCVCCEKPVGDNPKTYCSDGQFITDTPEELFEANGADYEAYEANDEDPGFGWHDAVVIGPECIKKFAVVKS